MRGVRARVTLVTSVLLIVAGAVITAQAVLAGGALGVLVGVMFTTAGVMRIVLLRR